MDNDARAQNYCPSPVQLYICWQRVSSLRYDYYARRGVPLPVHSRFGTRVRDLAQKIDVNGGGEVFAIDGDGMEGVSEQTSDLQPVLVLRGWGEQYSPPHL
jgi:hypothetical protein